MSDFKSLYKSPQINGAIGWSVWYNVTNGEICFATELKNFNLAQSTASLLSHTLSRHYKFQYCCNWIPGLFQDLGFFRHGNLNILIPGLARVCTNPVPGTSTYFRPTASCLNPNSNVSWLLPKHDCFFRGSYAIFSPNSVKTEQVVFAQSC